MGLGFVCLDGFGRVVSHLRKVTDPERMHRVLQGEEALPSHVMAVHFFRKAP